MDQYDTLNDTSGLASTECSSTTVTHKHSDVEHYEGHRMVPSLWTQIHVDGSFEELLPVVYTPTVGKA